MFIKILYIYIKHNSYNFNNNNTSRLIFRINTNKENTIIYIITLLKKVKVFNDYRKETKKFKL